jgi:hypothetical protein
MSDDNKVELVAAAQISAFAGPPAGIEFNSNFGFQTATRSGDGSYVLELKHEHDARKLVINVTRNNQVPGEIEASILDDTHIQVLSFGFSPAPPFAAVPTDTSFFITVNRVRD